MDAARADLERRIATLDWLAIKSAVIELADSAPTQVPLSDIEAFERECGISLPDDYREFLLMIGMPAPGPGDGGLVPFGCDFPHDADPPMELWTFPALSEDERGWLRLPFPGRNTGDEDADAEYNDDAMEHWGAEGVLPLTTDLCTCWAYLVMTGDERGRVWEREDGMHPARTPLSRPVSFRDWYALWLIREIDEELPRIRENRKIPADRFATDAELAALRHSSRR